MEGFEAMLNGFRDPPKDASQPNAAELAESFKPPTGFIFNVVEIVLLITAAVVVLLVEAIPRIMMQIERDLYIPMLLQALGMAGGIAVEL
ncbi:hypothetical protein E2562_037594 [Oryza meyeriana var. granulata]|uniref:Uncharacterized protein n=1 Tax=Oryza meyeriana var. granulata TaxID=110450 RepID=A0A6G1E818_9ORYZ|nr:hypothetical protein E2562_037594 [Oryza meyeriana var. granulata]